VTDAFPASELPPGREYDVLVAVSRSGTTTEVAHALRRPSAARTVALKLRETAQAWTEAYPAFEYRHGPIAIAAPWRVVWSLGPLSPEIAADAGRAGATVVAPELDPLASLVLAQRTAVALAAARGLDPDRPRHLTRSIVLSEREAGVLSSAG
jgi:fructoselysine-6-P-deglycase FrlB-like protein